MPAKISLQCKISYPALRHSATSSVLNWSIQLLSPPDTVYMACYISYMLHTLLHCIVLHCAIHFSATTLPKDFLSKLLDHSQTIFSDSS